MVRGGDSYSLVRNAAGETFLLDTKAARVFVWDARGRYVRAFGGPGMGPGEFDISHRQITRVHLSLLGDMVLVYHGAKGEAHLFNSDGTYQRTLKQQLSKGMVRHLAATRDGRMIITQRHVDGKKITGYLSVWQEDFSPKSIAYEYEELKYEPIERGGELAGYLIHAFYAEPIAYADPSSDKILLGDNQGARFDVLDSDGKKLHQVRFQMPRRAVSDVDREEFSATPWIKDNPNNKIEYPEEHPWYNGILPTKDGYVVYAQSPVEREVLGVLIGPHGEPRGKLEFTCGENGGLFGSDGQIYVMSLDDNDQFLLRTVTLAKD